MSLGRLHVTTLIPEYVRLRSANCKDLPDSRERKQWLLESPRRVFNHPSLHQIYPPHYLSTLIPSHNLPPADAPQVILMVEMLELREMNHRNVK